jgi:hypothetical protein
MNLSGKHEARPPCVDIFVDLDGFVERIGQIVQLVRASASQIRACFRRKCFGLVACHLRSADNFLDQIFNGDQTSVPNIREYIADGYACSAFLLEQLHPPHALRQSVADG